MDVIICADDNQVGQVAGGVVADLLAEAEHPVLGVATGSSPLGLYDELTRRITAGELDLSEAKAFALDEYVGLPGDHPQSYGATIRRTVTEPFGMREENVRVLNGVAPDVSAECAQFEQEIKAAGGVDVQILGIGSNGHIAFNEPGSPLDSRTRQLELTEQTRADNARFFTGEGETVPTHSLTQGLGTIMEARHIVLVAQGAGKAEAIRDMVMGPVSEACPASVLQRHADVVVVVDEAAGALLPADEVDAGETDAESQA